MEHPIYSNPGHITQETVNRNSANFCSGAVWRTAATRAYFEKEINNHTQEEKKLFGKGKHVAKMLVTASRSWFVFLQLFFALTESILWPRKPSSASVTLPIWSSQESFQFGGIKLWHRQDAHQRLKRKKKMCNLPFSTEDWPQKSNGNTGQDRKNGKSLCERSRLYQVCLELWASTTYFKTFLKTNQNNIM